MLEDGVEEVQLETKAQPGRQDEDWEEEDADGIWNKGDDRGRARCLCNQDDSWFDQVLIMETGCT